MIVKLLQITAAGSADECGILSHDATRSENMERLGEY